MLGTVITTLAGKHAKNSFFVISKIGVPEHFFLNNCGCLKLTLCVFDLMETSLDLIVGNKIRRFLAMNIWL